MNWSSVKNLLILMLVAANIFLGVSIAQQDKRRSYIDEDELADAVAILAERGMTVNLEGIPRLRFESDIFESYYPKEDEYYDRVALSLSGSERERVHMLLDGGVRIISKNGAVTDFTKDFGFSYIVDSIFENEAYTGIKADSFAEDTEPLDRAGGSRLKQASELALDFMSTDSSDEPRLTITVDDSAYDSENDLIYLKVSQRINDAPIFRHSAVLIVEPERVIAAWGRWYFEGIDATYDCDPSDQVNTLFDDCDNLIKKLVGAESDAPLPSVTSMEACFAIYMSSDKTALYFIPAWHIIHNDGSTVVYNAAQSTQYFTS